MNEVRTYMSFTYPVDPARIQTIPDMDVSYALASTLVEWNPDKQIAAGLADKWQVVGTNVYRLTLRKDARWSDGSKLTCQDVKHSLERGLKVHPDDLRSLSAMLDSIECRSEQEIDFKLKVPAHDSGLLGKLTEPNFGVLKIAADNSVNAKVTTGAFFVAPESNKSELVLLQNANWFRFDSKAPQRVTIRRTPAGVDSQSVLLKDSWPNLTETSSLINEEILNRYQAERFQIWRRPLDKFFHVELGKRVAGTSGPALIKFLKAKINMKDLTAGLSGFTATEQVFPQGYQLFNSKFSCPTPTDAKLPSEFSDRPIEVLLSAARVPETLKENIRRTLKSATGKEPRFISASLDELRALKVRGEYDVYFSTVGLADPDPEGAMSFYLEGDASMIPQAGNSFLKRLDEARKEKDTQRRLGLMRSILADAVCDGYVLPIFHLSTIGIAKPELDLSNVPTSDESVTLSKIRFINGGAQ